jgi:hypothetical protein
MRTKCSWSSRSALRCRGRRGRGIAHARGRVLRVSSRRHARSSTPRPLTTIRSDASARGRRAASPNSPPSSSRFLGEVEPACDCTDRNHVEAASTHGRRLVLDLAAPTHGSSPGQRDSIRTPHIIAARSWFLSGACKSSPSRRLPRPIVVGANDSAARTTIPSPRDRPGTRSRAISPRANEAAMID